jgi:hypothetical protein
MASFVGNLASAGQANNSNIYGQPGTNNPNATLDIVNRIKDREKADFKDKANFMADLSLKQDRLRALYDPSKQNQQQGNPAPINNAAMPPIRDPNAIGTLDQAKLGMQQQQLNQQGKMGQQALDIKTSQEQLNQQKSDQIHQQKINELNAKQTDAKSKLDLATKALADKNTSADQQLKLHQSIMENTKAFHDADQARRQLQFDKTSDQHQQTIDNLQAQLKEKNKPTTTTQTKSSDGNTITTTKGTNQGTVNVKGKDGKTYSIPSNKLDDWNANHAPTPQSQPTADTSQQGITNNQSPITNNQAPNVNPQGSFQRQLTVNQPPASQAQPSQPTQQNQTSDDDEEDDSDGGD